MLTSRRKSPTPFTWDGSHLGTLSLNQVEILGEVKIGRMIKLIKITIGDHRICCLMKYANTKIPAILDELKPYFSLEKIGTHTFRYKGSLKIALKLYIDKCGKIDYGITLDRITDKKMLQELEDQVRKNLAFRELFGIKETIARSLNAVNINYSPKVLSYLEAGCLCENAEGCDLSTVIPEKLFQQWFTKKDCFDETVIGLLCFNRESPESTLSYYRHVIDEVVKRIDKDLIVIHNSFFRRLSQYIS